MKIEATDDERRRVSVFTGSIFEMLGVVADLHAAELLKEKIVSALREAVLCDRGLVRKFRDRKYAKEI